MMTKHTPGEWFHDKGKKPWTVRDDQGAVIAICPIYKLQGIERSRDELEANTKLIAAAPKMLQALKAAYELIPPPTPGSLGEERMMQTIDQVKATIAEALGELADD